MFNIKVVRFKPGDFYDYNNSRGVTLLPVISKIFYRMMLEQIKIGIEEALKGAG